MKVSLKELSKKEELLAPGHRLCAGCAESIIVRLVLLSSPYPVVACSPTGCLEVSTTIYPSTSWRISWIHSAFENAASTIAGVEGAYQALRKRGRVKEKMAFVVFAGDGGTYDIGFQALSGAIERQHTFLYVCMNNQAYMNTGIQRSSATPLGAATTTTPAGRKILGKQLMGKDLTKIIAAHPIKYAAQASISHPVDLVRKAQKAFMIEGPTFLNVFAPCPRGWRTLTEDTVSLAREAVQCCIWPLYEVEDGAYRINHRPKEKTPVAEWLKKQGRFAHLFRSKEGEELVHTLQEEVDREWEHLLSVAE